MAGDAKSAILGQICAANLGSGGSGTRAEEWLQIPRRFRSGSDLARPALMELLTHRLHDYGAQVVTITESDATQTVARMLSARGVSRMLVPEGCKAIYLPERFAFVTEKGLSATEMNAFDGVLTESTLAIAETGTIVLQTVPGQGRRAVSLVPDYHLCLVDASRIVGTVPEAIQWLQATADLPTTFISGPSATADIEMTRIKGVHGPRFLDVILLSS